MGMFSLARRRPRFYLTADHKVLEGQSQTLLNSD